MGFLGDIVDGVKGIFGFQNGTMSVPQGRVLNGVPVRVAVKPRRSRVKTGIKKKRRAKK